MLQLTEEGSQIRTVHQEQLQNLQAELQTQSSSQTSNTQDELTRFKRSSCGDIQQYLQGGLKALEDRCSCCLILVLPDYKLCFYLTFHLVNIITQLSHCVLARYEPILLALLKRREVTSGALVKAKEHAQELKAQLTPLQEEIQKLKLQRACLEEKLRLICMQRREDVGQYKVRNVAGSWGEERNCIKMEKAPKN